MLRPHLWSLTLLAALGAGRSAYAQGIAEQRPVSGWELPWLDINPNGGWRVRARAVAATRARLLGQRNFQSLNAPAAAGAVSATAVTGTLRVPVVMFRFKDTPTGQYARDTTQYDSTLFGAPPPNGKPYSLRTFYEEMSNGLFSIQGRAAGWVALDSNEATYTGAPGSCVNPFGGTTCNGLFSPDATTRMHNGLAEALSKIDATVDFSQYDDNGDGIVDAVLFLHATMDGACHNSTNNHLWSHRWAINYVTNDPRPGGGGNIVVSDYILQSGLGSPGGGVCDSSAIMPIGTAAHELGHILALPDLYDVGGTTQGIGEWGLMGAGNYTKPESPTRYDAWSLQQMGWATVVPLTAPGTYSVGPEPTADTVFYVDVQPPNPEPEHYLIENRQRVQSDSAVIRLHGGGGLMIWHIDDSYACMINICSGNGVNAGSIHGVALEEADGLRQLWCEVSCNRGDGGDPYPGTSGNRAFSFSTDPAATRNFDTSFAGIAIDSIQQLVPNGAMSFRLRFGGLTTVQASDTTVTVLVDATGYRVFHNLFDDGSTHTIAVDTPQVSLNGRTRFGFQSWSDGGAISHQVTGTITGATYTAALTKSHLLFVGITKYAGSDGTVSFNPAGDTSGTFILQGTPVTLTATPTAPFIFQGWSGDTVSANPTIALPMGRPYTVYASFAPQLVITSGDPRPDGLMGTPYADSLTATGGSGSSTWSKVSGSLPAGLTLASNGSIKGIPRQAGVFTFTARVTSGTQQPQQQFSLTVAAPALALSAVLSQLLTGTSTLSLTDIQYLDLLGNKSCPLGSPTADCFDVGDFLAWVQATGVTPVPPASALARNRGRP